MEQYISKSALVAEIKRRYNQEVQWMERQGYTEYNQGLRDGYTNILSFLGTLEIKEVDVEKELYDIKRACGIFKDNDIGEISSNCLNWVATHFFERGIQQSKKDSNNKEKK